MKLWVNPNKDLWISYALVSVFAIQSINSSVKMLFSLQNVAVRHLLSWISVGATGIIFLLVLSMVLKRKSNLFFMSYLLMSVLYLISLFRSPDTSAYILNDAVYTFSMVLPTFIYAASLRTTEYIIGLFQKCTPLILLLGFFASLTGNDEAYGYDMPYAYNLMPFVIFAIYTFIQKMDIKSFVSCLLGMVAILIKGNRGAQIIPLIFIIVQVVTSKRVRLWLKCLISILLAIGAGVIYSDTLVNRLYSLLVSYGIENRTLYLMLNGRFLDSSGRDLIAETTIEAIWKKPILGYGIATETQFLQQYPHNFILEILFDFGIVIGGLILVCLTGIFLYKLLILHSDTEWIWGCAFFLKLLMSGTYLTYMGFGLFLGLLIARLTERDKDKNQIATAKRKLIEWHL